MKNLKHIGNKIKELRIAKGIKQTQLAKMLNISQPVMSRLESKSIINDFILNKVSNILDVPISLLKTQNTKKSKNKVLRMLDNIECQIINMRQEILEMTA